MHKRVYITVEALNDSAVEGTEKNIRIYSFLFKERSYIITYKVNELLSRPFT